MWTVCGQNSAFVWYTDNMNTETATFANGCFWCTEAVFQRLRGVESVESGYSGGDVENPTYEEVCDGETGHAESLNIQFDPSVISFEKLLDVFFATHDPTTKNQQGNDIGPMYRSAIFYHNDAQQVAAEKKIRELNNSGKFQNTIVTEVTPFKNFYQAENYHKDFYNRNREYGYCRVIIDPKVRKILREYKKDVKDEYQAATE